MLLALGTAFILRFYRLGELPPGLYRDEAFNGLDALNVLQGQHPIFFQANNGREPIYIYLTAAAVALFGQTAFAVRLAAALVGSLTILPVYLLGKSWFGWLVGILAAWLWAITFWPVHLSRIGLRVILLAPLLAFTFWLGTLAYRRQKNWIWFAAGLIYGLSFYTYLAIRFTPILLIILASYFILSGRGRRLWPGAVWFALGTFLILLPLLFLIISQPDLFFGRTGQVSLLHPDVNGGDLWGTLLRQIAAALGLFIWRGDSILRHNLPGRPVFDLLMAVPFLIGLLWCLRKWRTPAAMVVLLWAAVMLGPTILAKDAPHFLRAAGILPVIFFFPALGLEQIWEWPRLPKSVRAFLLVGLIMGSLFLTVRDYNAYGQEPELEYVFEAPAARLARQINAEDAQSAVFVDERIWSNWPSISFLVTNADHIQRFAHAADLQQPLPESATIYAWPYEPLDYIPTVFAAAPTILVESGDLIPGEGEIPPYTLFVRYKSSDLDQSELPGAVFGDRIQLQRADVVELEDGRLQVDVYWRADGKVETDLVVFIHVIDKDQLIGQDDTPLALGRWPGDWWRPDLLIGERHLLSLNEAYDPEKQEIYLGLYHMVDGQRLPVHTDDGKFVGSTWQIGGVNEP